MEESSSRSLPMQTEIIDIGSSDSDSDIDFEFNEFFDGTTTQPRNHFEEFIEQNHGMGVHLPQHHSNGSASYASVRSRPWIGTSGEHISGTVGNRGKDEINHLSSEGPIHASQPKDHAGLAEEQPYRSCMNNGTFDVSHVSNEELRHDPQRQALKGMMSSATPKSDSVPTGQRTNATVSQNSKRILPSSLQSLTSGTISAPSTRFDRKALSPLQKSSIQAEKNRWSRGGPEDDAHNNGRLETAHVSGQSKLPGSAYVEDIGEMTDKTANNERERRALPSHWISKTANNSQMNASTHNRGTGQHPNFSTRPSYPLLPSKADNAQKSSDLPFRHEKLITSSKGLYKGSVV